MLYLTRRPGEAVIINNAIEVRVVELKGKSVKLGFTFPSDATVLREEVFLQIKAENEAAVTASADVLRGRSANPATSGAAPVATGSAAKAESDAAEGNGGADLQVPRRGNRSNPIDRLATAGDRRRPDDS